MPGEPNPNTIPTHSEVAELRARVAELEARIQVLERKEQVLHATLNSADDGILAVGECGQVIFANRRFEKMWHIPPDLMEAADDNELLSFVLDQLEQPDDFIAKVRELYKSFRTSTDTLRFRDGRIFVRTSQPLVVNDALCGRVWTFRDETPADAIKHGAHA
ncbi:MAG: PAS domain-containing protein [Candidatus Hydrogenedentes bacterium]|nr:PAS domain-containing protein [Candidatus Hydrogenedentota bacterium]